MEIQTAIPTHLSAGTTTVVRRSLKNYPASDGWSYTLYVRVATFVGKAGAVDGSDFVLSLTADDTASWPAGTYAYSERVSKDGEVYEVGNGRITVEANLALAGSGTGKSHAERTLEIIEAAIEGRLSQDIQSYQIAGRAVSKIPIKELIDLRGLYKSQVWRERNPGKFGQTVLVTFGAN